MGREDPSTALDLQTPARELAELDLSLSRFAAPSAALASSAPHFAQSGASGDCTPYTQAPCRARKFASRRSACPPGLVRLSESNRTYARRPLSVGKMGPSSHWDRRQTAGRVGNEGSHF
jgi:hypothetical protein